MSDYVTILQSAQKGRRFAKLFHQGQAASPKFPVWHRNGQVAIKNLKGFWKKVYRKYAPATDCCILRDKCVPDVGNDELCKVVRGKQQVRRKKGNFKDTGHHWVMFDIDKARVVSCNWKKNPEKACHAVIQTYLPEEFHNSKFIWAYSGSQGLGKPGVNVHLVFWMKQKVTNAEWRGWFKYHEIDTDIVDDSVFRPNQIHIIADPKLIETKDPFKKIQRAGFHTRGAVAVEFCMDASFVDTPKILPTFNPDSAFEKVTAYRKPRHIETFNNLVDAHEMLAHFGYIAKVGDPYGTPADDVAQVRYLHPQNTSDSPGTMLMQDGQIHSFSSNDLLNIGRYVDSWEAYLLLEANHINESRGLATDEDDEAIDIEFNADDAGLNPEEALEGLDEQDEIERMISPLLLAESRARRLVIEYGLRYMHNRYFTLDVQHNINLFKYVDLGKQAGGWRLAFEQKDKYMAEMSRFVFLNPELDNVDVGVWAFHTGAAAVKDIIKLYHADPNKRSYSTTGIFFNEGGPRVFDMWRGYSAEPGGDIKECQFFLDHLKDIICSGDVDRYEYLLDTFAGWFQFPKTRWGVVPVFVGGEGTGKGTVAQIIMSLYDASNVLQTSDLQNVLGRFNMVLANKVVVFLDDISFERSGANSDRSGKLKTLISEDTIYVEPKGQEGFKVPNCTHTIIGSNDLDTAVPATLDSRRYFITEVSGNKACNVGYFDGFYEAAASEQFKGALLNFFMERKITRNLRQAPKTEKLMDMAVKRIDHVSQWLIEMCELNTPIPYHEYADVAVHEDNETHLILGDQVNKKMIWESYEAFCNHLNVRGGKLTISGLGRKLTSVGFQTKRINNKTEGHGYVFVTPTKLELAAYLKYQTTGQREEEEENVKTKALLLAYEESCTTQNLGGTKKAR